MALTEKNTLLNKEYFGLVGTIDDFAKEKQIPYAVVGGGAVQAHLANIITTTSERPHYQSMREARDRLRDLFRPTDDLDVVMLTDENHKFFTFELGQYLQERFADEVKEGHKSLGITKDGHRIRVQIATDPRVYRGYKNELFNHQVDSANELNLIYDHRGKGTSTNIVVPTPEVLVLPKLSRFSSGDRIDIYNLTKALITSGIGFDRSEVRSLVKEFAPEHADSLMKNMDEILEAQLLNEQ